MGSASPDLDGFCAEDVSRAVPCWAVVGTGCMIDCIATIVSRVPDGGKDTPMKAIRTVIIEEGARRRCGGGRCLRVGTRGALRVPGST